MNIVQQSPSENLILKKVEIVCFCLPVSGQILGGPISIDKRYNQYRRVPAFVKKVNIIGYNFSFFD